MFFRIKRELTTMQMISYGFIVAILMGTILLMLPISSKDGSFTPFIDALFLSTSSICVTGLTTIVVVEHWNVFGQIVILCLIQFGGLGVVTFTTSIFLILHRRITLKERILIQDSYNLNTLGGLVKLTIKVIKGTFIVESIGAIFFAFEFIPKYGIIHGIWMSIFHSISAFCNAGIDLIGGDSFIPFSGSVIVNLTTMCLIVSGGIGFTVWWDLLRVIKNGINDKLNIKHIFNKLHLHSKIAVMMTLILIFGGAFIIFILEYTNPSTIGDFPLWQKIMASLFQSITTRTAGFSTIAQIDFENSTSFLSIMLMFVGGSPSGTAGGIKTVTMVVIILTTISVIKGKRDVEIFNRKITAEYTKKALAVMCFSFFTLMMSTMLLLVFEDADFIDILFEATSAIATVGLTRGITFDLSIMGKIIIILTMYLGRIGPITLALAFNPKKTKGKCCAFPEEDVLIG